jgi:REP element-mobilizing transposase RayT
LDDPIVKGIANDVWLALPAWFPTINLDEFVIMPNHTHFVIWLGVGTSLADVQDRGKPRPYQIPKPEKINTTPALGDVVGAFKSLVFKVYLAWIKINDPSRQAKFWQRNYYEHIVRNEHELNAIRQYIIDNPRNWKMDRDNLENLRNLSPPENVDEYLKDVEEMLKIKL